MEDLKEVKGIQFGLLTSAEILKYSVCEVNSPKLNVDIGTVYDERMGSLTNTNDCQSCGLKSKYCPGHFGHISLIEPLIHPLYYKYVIMFLKCICMKCSKLLIKKETLDLFNITKMKGEVRFKAILEKIEKIDCCYHCSTQQPKYTTNITDGKTVIISNYKIGKDITKINMEPRDIQVIFDNVENDQVILLGIDPTNFHPKSLIITNLVVLSPRSRPRVVADSNLCDDDLTLQYIEIIKKNIKLKELEHDDPKRKKEIDKLFFKIKSLFDNSQQKAKHSKQYC